MEVSTIFEIVRATVTTAQGVKNYLNKREQEKLERKRKKRNRLIIRVVFLSVCVALFYYLDGFETISNFWMSYI